MYEPKLTCGICGGEIAVAEGESSATCLGCGNTSANPKCDIKKLNRISYLRNELNFDAAEYLASELLGESPEESEAYWAALLCEYGIQYVREGSRRVPVCRKDVSALPAIKESENYKKTLYYAPAELQQNYEAMADAMEESAAVASNVMKSDEAYDVYILCREDATSDSDLDGSRLFLRFTENLNFKTFYIPETLKDMDAVEKAAHIVRAAKSSRIFIAPFANESDCHNGFMNYVTSIFAEAAEKDNDKVLFPIYNSGSISFQKLPEALVWLDAAFDSSDSEFMREISEETEKILKPEDAAIVPDAIVTATAANKENLIKRAYMFLEDGEFETADTYFDKILDIDIEESRAYIGKLLASCKIKSEDEIPNLPQTVTDDKNYIKAVRFAPPELKARYEALNGAIVERIESEKKRIAEDRERIRAERAELEEIERQRRLRQEKEERKMQYQRRRDPLRKTLLEVQAELSKTFLTPKRRNELKEQEEVLKKNIKELDAIFPDIFD